MQYNLRKYFICLLLVLLTGCAMVIHEADRTEYRTLGIAHVKECTYYENREDNVVKECTKVDTDAFSGWEAIMQGIGSMVVRIVTLGFK